MSQAWTSFVVPLSIAASAGVLLLAAAHDIASRTTPNWIALVLVTVGLALRAADETIPTGLIASGVVFAVAFVCWRRGWLGGGDVKLLTAVALLLPPLLVPSFIVAMSIAGALHAALYLIARRILPPPAVRRPRGLLARVLRAENWRIHRGGPLPYVCAIAAGFLFVTL